MGGEVFPCQPLLLLPLWHEDAEEEGDEDADEHRDEAEEEEVGLREEIHVEHRGCAAEEADDGSLRTDAREEDTHHEQTADGTAEETEDGVEVVQQRLDVNGSHQPRNSHAYHAGTDACDAGHLHLTALGRLLLHLTPQVHREGGGDGCGQPHPVVTTWQQPDALLY